MLNKLKNVVGVKFYCSRYGINVELTIKENYLIVKSFRSGDDGLDDIACFSWKIINEDNIDFIISGDEVTKTGKVLYLENPNTLINNELRFRVVKKASRKVRKQFKDVPKNKLFEVYLVDNCYIEIIDILSIKIKMRHIFYSIFKKK